jgi:coenzyme F420-0 gamma-glutamyl ligase (EC 6.3.2.-)
LSHYSLSLISLPGLPLVKPGDDLVCLIADGLARAGLALQPDDVLVVTSKIVSKAEGRFVELAAVEPSPEALRLAAVTGKDARLVELILRESSAVSRAAPGVLVVRHRLGFVSANAGIDQSNIENGGAAVLLLPLDPDASAQKLRAGLRDRTGVDVAVVLSDSHGRPFRLGNVGVAVGVSGLPALLDLRGTPDLFGRPLQITQVAYADLIASAAALLLGEGAEGRPVVLMRGLHRPPGEGHAADLNRPVEQDLYHTRTAQGCDESGPVQDAPVDPPLSRRTDPAGVDRNAAGGGELGALGA